jgi:hypothetical protein
MPHVAIAAPVGAALVSGAAGIVGGIAQGNANKRASQAQERANANALAFEREKYASDQAERTAMRAEQQRRYDIWERNRNAILKKHGIDFGGTAPGTPATAGAAVAGLSSARFGGLSPGPEAPEPPPLTAPVAPEEEMAASPDVFDWRNYGVR